MKKLIALLLALTLVFSMAACGSKGETPAPDGNTANTETNDPSTDDTSKEEETNPIDEMDLTTVMEDILKDVENLPMYEITELTEENFEFMTFIPYEDGYEAVSADALIGSIAHSVVLVRVPDGTDAAQVASDIEANANPNKWVCVGAEATHVRQHGNTILLVMSSVDTANAILVNFDSLAGEATPESDLATPVSGEDDAMEAIGDSVATPEDDTAEQPETSKPDNASNTNNSSSNTGSGSGTGTGSGNGSGTGAGNGTGGGAGNGTGGGNGNGTGSGSNTGSKPETPVQPETPAQPETPTTPEEKPTEPETPATSETDLAAVLSTVTAGIEDLPMSFSDMLTAENFESFAFIPYAEGYRGINGDAMIGSIAHSVVIVEVPEGTDAATVAADMKANANPRKWICVEAESVQTASKGNLAILVMSSQDWADTIIANFNAM